MKIFISTHPFGSVSAEPLEILRQAGVEVELNPYGRKIRPEELKNHLADKQGLIAGTERLDRALLDCAPELKIIARVGIGLDGIDFSALKERGILLTYTPEAVSQAVAELTVGAMLNLARSVHQTHLGMRSGRWDRVIGFEISGKTIGIIGFGRVGRKVAHLLQGFSCELLANDIAPDEEAGSRYGVKFCSKEEIYGRADIITLHVPLTPLTNNLIERSVLGQLKKGACLINTSRGGIVNEDDLYSALKNGDIAAAALDVYELEPYIGGRLCSLDNILLSCHSGSCSREARYAMELGAAREIARFKSAQSPLFPVREEIMQAERASRIVPINAEWHEIFNSAEERTDKEYRLYRSRWGQYPTHSIVGGYPLNLDVELVCNRNPGSDSIAWYTSVPAPETKYMPQALYANLMKELSGLEDPLAVKLGFRGDPLFHPDFERMLALARETGCIEALVTTGGAGLSEETIRALVANRLDVLTIYTAVRNPHSTEDAGQRAEVLDLCEKLNLLRRLKASSGAGVPRVKVFTRADPGDESGIREFREFWRYWSDSTAVVDPELADKGATPAPQAVKWACSRLWQRLVVSFEGRFLLCNYDFEEGCVIGRFPEMTIKEAWHDSRIENIRKLHRDSRSGEVHPCAACTFRRIEISKLSRAPN